MKHCSWFNPCFTVYNPNTPGTGRILLWEAHRWVIVSTNYIKCVCLIADAKRRSQAVRSHLVIGIAEILCRYDEYMLVSSIHRNASPAAPDFYPPSWTSPSPGPSCQPSLLPTSTWWTTPNYGKNQMNIWEFYNINSFILFAI